MAALSFLGCINIGMRLIREQYPEAELYEVECTIPGKAPASRPEDLSNLKIVCNAYKDGEQGTATISSLAVMQWGEFNGVEWIDQPWLEDQVIPWPPQEGALMEPQQADAEMKKQGYTQKYTAMTLREALLPDEYEPRYMFSMVDGTFVLVGAKDGKIVVEGQGQDGRDN